ncbi:MAG: C1 family peptidase [Ktedonobacterales bacterium]
MKQRILGSLTILAVAVLTVTTACSASSGAGPTGVGQTGATATATAGGASAHHGTGFVVNTQAPSPPTTIYSGSLPASVDLDQFNPPVGDQGAEGTCTAWATAYYLRGWYAKRDGYYPPSGFSPDFTYDQAPKDPNGGTDFQDNLKVQVTEGLDTMGDFFQPPTTPNVRYPPPATPTVLYPPADSAIAPVADSVLTNAARYRIAGYKDYQNLDGQSFVNYIKQVLASQNPLAIGIKVSTQFNNFKNLPASTTSDLITGTSGNLGGHAVFAYGYDQKGLLIENQWGTQWGFNGYAELSWGYVESLGLEVATITDPTETVPAFQQLPGTATAISVGADGAVWALGTTPVTGGYDIYYWNAVTWSWMAIPGGAVRIAVDPSGNPWVVNNAGNILRWDGYTWHQLPGAARDLAIGQYGTAWMIAAPPPTNRNGCPSAGCGATAETIAGIPSAGCQPNYVGCADGNISFWTGSAWQQFPGAGNRIADYGDSTPWDINSNGVISYYTQGNIVSTPGWVTVSSPGSAKAIAVAGAFCDSPCDENNAVWAIGSDGNLLRWYQTPGAWDTNLDSASAVAAAPGGSAWVVNSNGTIFELPAWADLDPSSPVE